MSESETTCEVRISQADGFTNLELWWGDERLCVLSSNKDPDSDDRFHIVAALASHKYVNDAALTQPAAPCGPELTEAQKDAIKFAIAWLKAQTELKAVMERASGELLDLCGHTKCLEDLLARSASPCDADTAERLRKAEALLESCWTVMDGFNVAAATKAAIDEFLGEPKLAEAEAALAAKGGAE